MINDLLILIYLSLRRLNKRVNITILRANKINIVLRFIEV